MLFRVLWREREREKKGNGQPTIFDLCRTKKKSVF
jgi:hypothetical protein